MIISWKFPQIRAKARALEMKRSWKGNQVSSNLGQGWYVSEKSKRLAVKRDCRLLLNE